MKISILSFSVAITLMAVTMISCKDKKSGTTTATTSTSSTEREELPYSGRIAYVDIDSFEANYEFLKTKRAAFEKKQIAIEEELVRIERQLQNDAEAFQKKIQAGTMTQSEGEATQKRLMQQGQNLEQKKQTYTEQLMKEQGTFNEELRNSLSDFLKEYNKDKGYDFIMSYTYGSSILYANEAMNITEDVIKGMNERKTETKSSTSDTTKK